MGKITNITTSVPSRIFTNSLYLYSFSNSLYIRVSTSVNIPNTVWVFYHGKPNDSELIFSRILSVPKRRIPIRNFGSPNQIREKKRNDQSRPFVWGYQNSVWRSSVWGHSESARKINSESFGILWIQIRTVSRFHSDFYDAISPIWFSVFTFIVFN